MAAGFSSKRELTNPANASTFSTLTTVSGAMAAAVLGAEQRRGLGERRYVEYLPRKWLATIYDLPS